MHSVKHSVLFNAVNEETCPTLLITIYSLALLPPCLNIFWFKLGLYVGDIVPICPHAVQVYLPLIFT